MYSHVCVRVYVWCLSIEHNTKELQSSWYFACRCVCGGVCKCVCVCVYVYIYMNVYQPALRESGETDGRRLRRLPGARPGAISNNQSGLIINQVHPLRAVTDAHGVGANSSQSHGLGSPFTTVIPVYNRRRRLPRDASSVDYQALRQVLFICR